ncbi:hypothetical protein AO072_05425 [Pseudomonas syringae ICMP 13102]|uniref:hypothetical protein n=1 Tax=Pseudomonas syringae TaxID=317 RepID=UPI0007308ABB|nr:hypothetical protein [Pseudomonas syringae]KTB75772.1 hypothetical protein AO072_05425 [Pseudomonas syringae ICMP 13102]
MRLKSLLLAAAFFTPALAVAEPSQTQKDFITYLVKSGREPKVKDATWMTDSNLYVGVFDDRSRRDGFADYICSVAGDHGVSPELVKIIDIVKLVRTGKFVEIGKSVCK